MTVLSSYLKKGCGAEMELSQLRYFAEVARTQHITKSAENLHIAQPSLTKVIHNLEDEFGVPLFIHKGRNIVLSEYGKYLQKKIVPILKELDEIPEMLHTMANLSNETIHLNVLASSVFLTEAIVEYKKNHPDIKFEFLQNNREDIYDIQISTKLFYQLRGDEASTAFVCNEKIFLAVPNIEKYENISSVCLRDVMGEKFISLSDSRQFRTICDKLCQHSGFSPQIVFESDSPMAVMDMIASNIGVGFWPEFSWGPVMSENIKLLSIADGLFSRDIIVSYKLNKLDNSSVIEFYNFLRGYCDRAKNSDVSDGMYKNNPDFRK